MKILILDLKLGNLNSIYNVLSSLDTNIEISISNKISEVNEADKIIIAGVGAYDTAVQNLYDLNLIDVLNESRNRGKHILGICLGMQLMTISSEEGDLKGLGWINSVCKKFDHNNLSVPHMGWNIVNYDKDCKLYRDIPHFTASSPRFYFVHSYYIKSCDDYCKFGITKYGEDFISSFSKDNIFGVQFHPEKSLSYGLKLINNFVKL